MMRSGSSINHCYIMHRLLLVLSLSLCIVSVSGASETSEAELTKICSTENRSVDSDAESCEQNQASSSDDVPRTSTIRESEADQQSSQQESIEDDEYDEVGQYDGPMESRFLPEVSAFPLHECLDKDPQCEAYVNNNSEDNECDENPYFMMHHCRKTCNACDTRIDMGMGEPQIISLFHARETWERIIEARHYLNLIWYDEFLGAAYESCTNDDPLCAYWGVMGHCDGDHAEWMQYNCAPICGTCETTSVHTRCPLDPDAKNAWEPGDLNRYFERITTAEEFQRYEPRVWSRPTLLEGDTEETADYILGPWVVTMENYVNETEARRMIELGGIEGYERSGEFGEEQEDGTVGDSVNDRRTSMNAWCQNKCAEDPIAKNLTERMAYLAGMPSDNAEEFQLLRYEPGQYYKVHHDFSWHETERQQGPRILTIFCYLNDPEEGGETDFPNINITVVPKRGRIVLWPSVFDDEPEEIDLRTEHQSLPVTKGVKYGANLWFHQRNFTDSAANECTW